MIRHAAFDDILKFLPLLEELGYPCGLEELQNRVTKFLSNIGYGIAVYEISNEIVGLVAWSRSDLFVSNSVRFHIEALIISQSHRRKSIGKKLMEFVEDIAKENSPAIIDLKSGLRRAAEGVHEFYDRLGYKNEGPAAKIYLRKEL